jgi:hypothetical protein
MPAKEKRIVSKSEMTNKKKSSSKIEVSAVEFVRMNKGLITVLKAVAQAGDDGITTRKLLRKIGMIGYGLTLVERAYSLGYIKRIPPAPPSKDEFPQPRYNIITSKGKRLLIQLTHIE